MTGTLSELARRAFDGVLDMKASAAMSELDQTSSALFTSLGLPHFALARFFSTNRAPATKVLAGRFHPEWSRRYVARGYAGSSTIASEMLVTSSSYTWSSVIQRRGINPDQARIWNEASDFGLTDGLFTPVRWSDGGYAAVVLSGHKPVLEDPFLAVSAEVLSGYYSSEVRRLTSASATKAVLTNRQRECLAWVRAGKSSADIAGILGISMLTVDEHVAEACRKLGVRSRVQAAVEAALAGIID
jgi:DNA-binding CsgD family transcriptional regulator